MLRVIGRLFILAVTLALVASLWPQQVVAEGTVVVQPGDTLSAIAARNGTTVSALVAANGLASPDLLWVGQRLSLPRAGVVQTTAAVDPRPDVSSASEVQAPTAAPRPALVAANAVPMAPTDHVVRPGETLFRIAGLYGSSVGDLMAANHLTSANVIYAGQRLLLPRPGLGIGQADVPAPSPPEAAVAAAAPSSNHHIVVTLSNQTLTAYEGDTPVATFDISSGRAWTPTLVGTFHIYRRYESQLMVGPGYYLPGVPYVQYFVGEYALHGAYWHNLFGTPTSHGCVNLRVPDAEWLWYWANIGTEVRVEQ